MYIVKKHYLFIFLLFYINLLALPIVIQSDTSSISILESSSVFIDKGAKKNISEIIKEEKKFTPISDKFINYGYMFEDTLWIKFSVHNSADKDIRKYLVFDSPNIDIINLYFYKNNKEYLLKNGIFNRKSFESELSFSFPLALQANETITYYLELKPITHSLHFSLKIKDYKTFKNDELHHQLILTLFFGILFVIMIYNAVIFINTKNSIYIYYSFFILTLFIHHLHIKGMIAYLLPSNPQIFTMLAYMPIYNLAIVLIAMFLFVSKFLNLYLYKKLYFVLKLFILAILAILVFHSSENYILNYLTPLALLFALYVEFIGFYLFIKTDEKNAKYFFIIWSISLGGMIGTMLYYVGVLPSAIPYLFETTVVIEVFLFSIVLASQIKDLQKEKLKNSKIIIEQSKLAIMGEMIRNISHQWRQPLSEINAMLMKIDADNFTKKLTTLTLEKDISKVEHIVMHMSSTIENYNNFFKQDKRKEEITLKQCVKDALKIVDFSIENKKITINLNIQDSTKLTLYKGELVQVILVLLNNAIDILSTLKVEKSITITTAKKDDKYILSIEDNGGGVKETSIAKIFDAYFSEKENGTGIGLFMSKSIIETSLNGKLEVTNTPYGAKFTLIL